MLESKVSANNGEVFRDEYEWENNAGSKSVAGH